MELRQLGQFVAVVEEGGMSAASRRLHVSQSALSQTVTALERELGVKLLVRNSSGVQPTPAGTTLLHEARAVLARHAQAMRAMADFTTETTGVIRLGVPLEMSPSVLPDTLSRFSKDCPEARVVPRHLSSAHQFTALGVDELDVGLVRERPCGSQFDSMLVLREKLGVLLAAEVANRVGDDDGVPLEALAGMEWLGFNRSGSPAWHDELTATFRAHGVDADAGTDEDRKLIPAVKLIGVRAGNAFALVAENWPHPLPDDVRWLPLIGNPITRRTWVVWPADSRRKDVAHLVAAFEVTDL
jgi:DNA-binding transcriptional LysR family regulator